jgi:dTDP-4-amino-4,6-dideoxygalactose transaminase
MSSGGPIPFARPSLPPLAEFASALEPAWERRMLSNFATEAQRFEELCRAYTGAEHACCAANADLGLTLAVAALEVPAGSVALLPSFTFNSTVNAVIWNRLRPRFVDAHPETFCIDPAAVERELGPDVGLVIGVHLFGSACDVDELERLAAGAGVPVLYDAAQAFGTFVGDRHAGRFGDASVFSFSPPKVVTAAEGALVTFRDPDVRERFEHLRNYGFRDGYETRYIGMNAKLSELHAALGCLTVPTVEREVDARSLRIRRYEERLAGVVRAKRVPETVRPSWTYCAVDLGQDAEPVERALGARGIETRRYFHPLHLMELLREHAPGPLPVTERLAGSLLCLPLFADMPLEDVDRVATELAAVLERAPAHP